MSLDNMAEIPNHGTILSDINHRRRTLDLSDREKQWISAFYGTSELEQVIPKGFPSMAVAKMRWPNAATFRTFGYLDFRRLEFYETKLAYLENQLHKLDKTENQIMEGAQKNQAPFNKSCMNYHFRDSTPLHGPEVLELHENMSQDEINYFRERLYADMECLAKKHHELVLWLKKVREFPRVRLLAQVDLSTMARDYHKLDNEAVDHLSALDEMAYTSIDPVELWIQNIRLSTIPWIQKILRCFPNRDVTPNHEASQTYNAIGVGIFTILHKAVVLLSSLSLVLVPAGLLLLGGFSKALSYGIVVIFGVIFAIVILLVEQRIGHAVLGIVAYLALLATFLANTT
ncbi:hypothetical protein F5Y09DRAFT_330091 [Xylaria sp. FL1042]|nr:hypothetical protein F5Y09DRAFT_330091 [Xylaria sp. FL1042]